MTDITPPPELVGEWWIAWDALEETDQPRLEDFIAVKAAQWGADQELEACCKLVPGLTNYFRVTRRPKPPSLKKQALEVLDDVEFDFCTGKRTDIIRRALEQLND